MKKMSVIFSMLVLAALMLSACAGGGDNQQTPGAPGTGLETPGAAEPGATPDVGLEPTPTLEVVDEAPTEVVMTPTVEAGADGAVETTGTPAAEVPVTGGDVCVPNRLTHILDFEVRDNAGNIVGEVEGVVVMRDTSVAGAPDGTPTAEGTADPNAAPTDAAGAVETPAADGTTVPDGDDVLNDQPMVQPTNLAEPHLSYVIVDVDDLNETLGDRDVLVPFTAFQGLTPETPVEDCALVLAGDAATLENAPAFDDDAWDELYDEDNFAEWHGFWANAGVMVPTTGANGAELGAPVIFEDDFSDIDVENTNGDDLGEIEEFVLDSATGQFQYAVLATGGFLGIGVRYIPIPVSHLMWGEMDDDPDDLGEMVVNVPEDQWENAPSFDSLDDFDTTTEGWETELEAFWTSVTQ